MKNNFFFFAVFLLTCSCKNINNFTLYEMVGDGMYPAIESGEYFIINTTDRDYNYGNIISYCGWDFLSEEDIYYIWRIVALEGDTIHVNYDQFSIEGKNIDYTKICDDILLNDGNLYEQFEEKLPNGKKHMILRSLPLSLELYLEQTVVIPHSYFYGLCDVRSGTLDSRSMRAVPKDKIFGKVVKVVKNKNFITAHWEFYKYALWGPKKEHEK